MSWPSCPHQIGDQPKATHNLGDGRCSKQAASTKNHWRTLVTVLFPTCAETCGHSLPQSFPKFSCMNPTGPGQRP